MSGGRAGPIRAVVFALILVLLAGCGGVPAVRKAVVPDSSPIGAGSTPAPGAIEVLPPSAAANVPLPSQSTLPQTGTTPSNSGTGASTGLSEPLRRGYSALAMLQGVSVVLDETAQQMQAGKLDDARVQDVLAATDSVLKSVRDVLSEPPPADGMQTAWDEADHEVAQIQDIVSRWSANKLSLREVEDQLKPVQEQGTHMLSTAESALTQEFGVDPGALRQAREDALNSVRNTLLATPTPR